MDKRIRATIRPITTGDWVQIYTANGELEGSALVLRWNPFSETFLLQPSGKPKDQAIVRGIHEVKPL